MMFKSCDVAVIRLALEALKKIGTHDFAICLNITVS